GAGSDLGTAVDRVARPAVALGERLHLGRHGDRLAVVGELTLRRARDPDRDRYEWDVLEHAFAVLHPDEPAVQVLRLVELGPGLVEPLADALGDLLGTVRDHDRDEVVAAHMADESLGPGPLDHRVLDDARGR